MTSWSYVTVGVADLDVALTLWVDAFGLEVVAHRAGPDSSLAEIWALQPADIARQVLLRTPGQSYGMLHLVQFVDPLPPVRAGAAVFDLLPKNLDVHVQDLPHRFAELEAKGYSFRTRSHSTITAPSGDTFREIHLPAHDEINVVLLEVLGQPLPFTAQGFAGIGLVVTIVPDTAKEKQFYQQILGLEVSAENYLAGPEIEQMVGLPSGSALNVAILGGQQDHFGLLELVEYSGVVGRNRYPQARPKALGTLMVSYAVDNLAQLASRLRRAGVAFNSFGNVRTLAYRGAMIAFHSPAGFRLQVHER